MAINYPYKRSFTGGNMKDLETKLELALKEIERLKQENHQLKQKLADITKDDSPFCFIEVTKQIIRMEFIFTSKRNVLKTS